jgi:hypothetical protein
MMFTAGGLIGRFVPKFRLWQPAQLAAWLITFQATEVDAQNSVGHL